MYPKIASSIIWIASMDDASIIRIRIFDQLELLKGFLHSNKPVVRAITLTFSPIDLQMFLKLSNMVELRETWLHNPSCTNKIFLS